MNCFSFVSSTLKIFTLNQLMSAHRGSFESILQIDGQAKALFLSLVSALHTELAKAGF